MCDEKGKRHKPRHIAFSGYILQKKRVRHKGIYILEWRSFHKFPQAVNKINNSKCIDDAINLTIMLINFILLLKEEV